MLITMQYTMLSLPSTPILYRGKYATTLVTSKPHSVCLEAVKASQKCHACCSVRTVVCAAAQVSDFGLARDLDILSKIETKTTGTVTHMAPEVLAKGVVSKAADCFSFGVLLWEMASGQRAWAGLTHPQVSPIRWAVVGCTRIE